MGKKILNYLLSLGWLGPIGEALNGKKTILGIIALIVYALAAAHTVIPECTVCPQIATGIESALGWIGVVLPAVGIAHKVVKAKLDE